MDFRVIRIFKLLGHKNLGGSRQNLLFSFLDGTAYALFAGVRISSALRRI
jgi:hypothetical protein